LIELQSRAMEKLSLEAPPPADASEALQARFCHFAATEVAKQLRELTIPQAMAALATLMTSLALHQHDFDQVAASKSLDTMNEAMKEDMALFAELICAQLRTSLKVN
jgi:hypothetical protein